MMNQSREELMDLLPGVTIDTNTESSVEERLLVGGMASEGYFEVVSAGVYRRTKRGSACTAVHVAEARLSMRPHGTVIRSNSLDPNEVQAMRKLVLQGWYADEGMGRYRRIDERPPLHQIREVVPDSDIEKMLDSSAVHDVLAERCRQINDKGYSPVKDDAYNHHELVWAARAYLEVSITVDDARSARSLWPWDPRSFHPTDRRSNLVKAAALALAEIERLDRAEAACKSKTASSTVDRFNSSSPSYPLARR